MWVFLQQLLVTNWGAFVHVKYFPHHEMQSENSKEKSTKNVKVRNKRQGEEKSNKVFVSPLNRITKIQRVSLKPNPTKQTDILSPFKTVLGTGLFGVNFPKAYKRNGG